MSTDEQAAIKLILVGDGGTGKTTLVKHFLTGQFERRYIPTRGVDVCPITFNTNIGPIRFDVWDIGGQKQFSGPRDEYYRQAQCAIVMFDVTSLITYNNVPQWLLDVERVCEDIPIVLCGNKTDVQERIVKLDAVNHYKMKGLEYFDTCVKSSHNLEKPFIWLARRLISNNAIEFTSEFRLIPTEVQIDREDIQSRIPPEVQIDPTRMTSTNYPGFNATCPIPEDNDDL